MSFYFISLTEHESHSAVTVIPRTNVPSLYLAIFPYLPLLCSYILCAGIYFSSTSRPAPAHPFLPLPSHPHLPLVIHTVDPFICPVLLIQTLCQFDLRIQQETVISNVNPHRCGWNPAAKHRSRCRNIRSHTLLRMHI